MNKILPISLVVFSVFFFSGCSKKSAEVGVPISTNNPNTSKPISNNVATENTNNISNTTSADTSTTSTIPKDCAIACTKIIPATDIPQISASELASGMYYGSLAQKKKGTPEDWIHTGGRTRSATWQAAKTAADSNCDCDKK